MAQKGRNREGIGMKNNMNEAHPFTTSAMVHSLNALDTVTILRKRDNNHVLAEYKGQKCTAVDNPFSGYFYVDDVYGVFPEGMSDEEIRSRGY